MNQAVQDALTDIFMAVADAADGGDGLPEDVNKAYNDALKIPEFAAFCDELNKDPFDAVARKDAV